MKLHTSLDYRQVRDALSAAKAKGRVGQAVMFDPCSRGGSRTHQHGYEVQLGAYSNELPAGTVDQYGHNLRVRRTRNGSNYTDDARFAATWDEWGWFMAEVFAQDPDARFGDLKGYGYKGVDDFNAKTEARFMEQADAR